MKIMQLNRAQFTLCLVILIQFFQQSGFSSCIFEKEIEAKELDIGNMISWTTVQETQNEYFIIEKSINGIDFKEVSQINAAGNSEEQNAYRFLDIATGEMQSFYRLKQLDFDKQQSYSKTVIVNRKSANNLVITGMSSTMTDGVFSLTVRSETAGWCTYNITDENGVSEDPNEIEIVKGVNVLSFELNGMNNGHYHLSLSLNDETESIIIEKVAPNQMPRIDYVVRE